MDMRQERNGQCQLIAKLAKCLFACVFFFFALAKGIPNWKRCCEEVTLKRRRVCLLVSSTIILRDAGATLEVGKRKRGLDQDKVKAKDKAE